MSATRKGLFEHFRTIGLVNSVDGVPMAVNTLGTETFLVASIGHAWQVLRASNLSVALISRSLPRRIRALAAKGKLIFAAVGEDVVIWKRADIIGRLRGSDTNGGKVSSLLVFGDLLLTLSAGTRTLSVWFIKSKKLRNKIDFGSAVPTAVMHPHTYLNKVLVGMADGQLQLWNIRSGKRVHVMQHVGGARGTELCGAVQVLEQSPALDVVAVGYSDGFLALHNIRVDQTVMMFHEASGAVTAITFNCNHHSGQQLMISGSSSGQVSVWDLEQRAMRSKISNAHTAAGGGVSQLAFLPGQQRVLVSAGADNAVREWVMDAMLGTSGGEPRLLRSRSGHKAPPSLIRYYGGDTLATTADGADGRCCQLLSAGGEGDRSLWCFHTARARQSRELSQAAGLLKKAQRLQIPLEELKLSPILALASSDTKERDWGNIVTVHRNHNLAHIWSFRKRRLEGSKTVRSKDGSACLCCDVSICGNWGVMGTETGGVRKFNLQSAGLRGDFAGHKAAVTGVAIGGCNRTLVTVSLDSTLRFWAFKSRRCTHVLRLKQPGRGLRLHRLNGLVAVALEDFGVSIFDCVTHALVRQFGGRGREVSHTSGVSDFTFDPTGKWLVTSSGDQTLRVWDIPTARCVEWLKFRRTITSLTFSLDGSYLATTHAGELGVCIWVNRSRFESVYLDTIPDSPVDVHELKQKHWDRIGGGGGGDSESDESSEEEESSDSEEEDKADREVPGTTLDTSGEPQSLSNSTIITLSAVAHAKWANLSKLTLIRERNRPELPPEKPPLAPFFLDVPAANAAKVFEPEKKKGKGKGKAVAAVEDSETGAEAKESTAEDFDASDFPTDGWNDDADDDNDNNIKNDNSDEKDDKDEKDEKDEKDGLEQVAPAAPVNVSRLLNKLRSVERPTSALAQLLDGPASPASDTRVMEYFLGLNPSAIDLGIRSLTRVGLDFGPDSLVTPLDSEVESLHRLLQWVRRQVDRQRSFQFVQAILEVVLRVHGEAIAGVPRLKRAARELAALQKQTWSKLQTLLHQNLCLIKHFSGQQQFF